MAVIPRRGSPIAMAVIGSCSQPRQRLRGGCVPLRLQSRCQCVSVMVSCKDGIEAPGNFESISSIRTRDTWFARAAGLPEGRPEVEIAGGEEKRPIAVSI